MLTHVDKNNLPTMVDVTGKEISARTAAAESVVILPEIFRAHFEGQELHLKKGPVFNTAIIAGTMAVKKTYELIPFCHQIPVESCKFTITADENLRVKITCTVKTTYKTGVEMEALHGAMTAALTIYDMCKALSHDIVIGPTKLLAKTGGKRTVLEGPLYGLVLTGGKSERMKRDKALISYHGVPHALYLSNVLGKFCDDVYVSARSGQWENTALADLPVIEDQPGSTGPIAGILSAMEKFPEANWIVVACDLVYFNEETVEKLLSSYDPEKVAVAYRNSEKDFPEPLCTLYTPKAREIFRMTASEEITCPVKVLKKADVTVLSQTGNVNLANVNTTQEYAEVVRETH
jgi:cyclic pyranopterin phosphate synthase